MTIFMISTAPAMTPGGSFQQVYELQATVEDFSGDQALLTGRVDALLASFGELHGQRDGAAFNVPIDLIRCRYDHPSNAANWLCSHRGSIQSDLRGSLLSPSCAGQVPHKLA